MDLKLCHLTISGMTSGFVRNGVVMVTITMLWVSVIAHAKDGVTMAPGAGSNVVQSPLPLLHVATLIALKIVLPAPITLLTLCFQLRKCYPTSSRRKLLLLSEVELRRV
jgi:hypothetical protein